MAIRITLYLQKIIGRILSGLWVFLLFVSSSGYGQSDSDVWFRNLGLKEGIPNTSIYDLHQDSAGFIWATTQAGIVRYDGYNFKTFKAPSQNGIPSSNLADKIVEDNSGVVWSGFQDSYYIARYDSLQGEFDFINMQEKLDLDGEIQHTRLLGVDMQNKLWAALLMRNKPEQSVLVSINPDNLSIRAFVDEEGNTAIESSYFEPRFFAGHINYNVFLPRENGVWIGTNNGLNFINNKDQVTTYVDSENGFKGMHVNHLLDNGDDIWVATDSTLLSFDEETETFRIPKDFDESVSPMHLYKDDDGTIWITAAEHTYQFKNDKATNLNEHPDLQDFDAVSMAPQVETEKEIWFVNRQQRNVNNAPSTDGFTIYDKAENRFTTVRSNFEDYGLKRGSNITEIMTGKSGSIWLGTMYSGLYQFPERFKKFGVLFDEERFQELIGDMFILNATQSPNGHIFASVGNGKILAKNAFSGEEIVFKEFETLYNKNLAPRNYIPTIHIETPGKMYIATERSGFNRFEYDPKTLEITDEKTWLPEDFIDANLINIHHDNENNRWIGTTSGMLKVDLESEEFTAVNAIESEEFNPLNNFGSDILKDEQGNFWIYNVTDGGIKRLKPAKEKAEIFNSPTENTSDIDQLPFVEDMVEMDNGDILAIADYIYRFNRDSSRFDRFIDDKIPNMTAIKESREGNLLIATYGEGLFWIDYDTGEIQRRLSTEDGLANASISDLWIDKNGDYWLLTSLGLSKYNPQNNAIVNYFNNHGLPASESQTNYQFFGNDSTLFPIWISNKGLSVVDIDQINTNSYSPKPVFTNVTAGKEPLPLMDDNDITIPHDRNDINIAFSSLQFDDPTKNQYRYTLGDEDWSPWSRTRSVQLAELSPGTYTLHVQSRNPDMISSSKSASYTFTLAPPWYQSTFAYLFYVLFGMGGLAWAAFWYSNYRTEQRAMRMQAEQAEELAKLDRMKTNLLTNISHELRTPLTLVLGPLEQLRNKAADLGKNWKHKLDIAQRNGQRLHQLVEQVLDLTRLDSQQLELNPKNIELTAFLRRLAESFESMTERKGVTIETNLPNETIPLQADPDKLEKAMVNLLSNAIKFTPTDGIVRLTISRGEDTVEIVVADTGRGIAADRLPYIFDRFHSTSEEISGGGKGLGVGLAITKEFIELHDGRISVESEEGSGTNFKVQLPQQDHDRTLDDFTIDDIPGKEGELSNESPAPRNGIPMTKDPFTVLVVEDNDDMRAYIAELLTDKNLAVETAQNGLDAKKKLSIIAPDLIVSDIMMPEMDGFTFAEHVRSTPDFRLTPIVMLSARAEVKDRIQGYEIGVSDYLAKPFDETELKARVKNLLRLKSERKKHAIDKEQQPTNIETSSLVKKLQAYVEANLSESKITVEQLSEQAKLSRRQMYRKLKAETGCTPAEFIREIRLYHARDILERSNKKTVSQIAYAVGFSTPSYFSKLFKERFGRSPSEYGK